jgi:precorrin-6B methylase 2
MEFTESLFQRRLAHVLAAWSDRKRAPPQPIAFRFSRKRAANISARPNAFAVVQRLNADLRELVMEYARVQTGWHSGGPAAGVPFAEVDGHVLWAPASDWKLLCHYLISAALDPALAGFLRAKLKPGSVFLDIGASLGAYTVLAAGLTGLGGAVLSFEGMPQAYRWLVRNLADAGYGTDGRVRVREGWIAEASDTFALGPAIDLVRVGGTCPALEVLRSLEGICKLNPECRIVVDYCAALQPVTVPLSVIVAEMEQIGFSIQQIDRRTGALAPLQHDKTLSEFSAALVLEQHEGMSWKE